MTNQTTYTKARANLARLCNQVADNREVIIINRRGGEDVALVAASELSSLLETAICSDLRRMLGGSCRH